MHLTQSVTKAVIPCAGYGTRFLPATKASPKEMLPIVDKPVIQYIVEEAVASGITEIILITGTNKRAIEDHFDYNFELEEVLKRNNKLEQYQEIRDISDLARFVYIRQKEQLGNGHAVLQAKEVIGDEPFAVLWGDEFYHSNPPRMKQLIEAYKHYGGAILSTYVSNDPAAPHKYGIVDGDRVSENIVHVRKVVEKPGDEAKAPYLVGFGGYVFPPSIFDALEKVKPGKGGEIWLMDAVNQLAKDEAVYAYELEGGRYYDCGSKLGYLKANIDFGLQHSELREDLNKYLQTVVKERHET